MHGNRQDLFLRHDKVQAVLQVVHVPHFDDTVRTTRSNQVVLVKLIQSTVPLTVNLLRLELIRRDILKVDGCEGIVGVMA